MTERELFFAALDHDAPVDRAAYLDRACGGDTALRRRVEALLESHATAGEFLDTPAAEQVAGDAGGPLDILAPSQRPDSLGRLGHYEVLEIVSRGGMGVVFRAFDDKLQRVVAIKSLAPQLLPGGTARQRFVREARAAAAVTHDNVIAIHAVEDAGTVPYLVMQFVDGPTLQQKLDRTGPLPVKEVLRIGLQVAEGLAAAHKQGLIHRDIKPANILLENGVERVKLTDFGLARAGDDATLTEPGVVVGTPMYMSPEQAEGRPVDFRSDLFSLGGVLYAMCTGQPPFRGPTTGAVLRRVSDEASQPIRDTNPDIPEGLCAVITRLQAKAPADRFQTAADVADVLGRQLARLQQPTPDSPGPGGILRASWSSGVLVALLTVLAVVGGLAGYPNFRDPGTAPAGIEPIRVGVLHSQSGTMGSSESAAIDATLLAVNEINQAGGLLGRPVRPVVVDGMSDWPTYAREAERLIAAERVCTIFGCWTSASRKAVVPVVERHDHLLVYPMQYEGFEQSPCVVYTGAVPNQQVTPAVRWCVEHLGKRFFLVGSDYVWPRATGEVIRDQLAELGGELVGEAYLPLETAAVQAVVRQVVQAKPDVIIEMVAGDSKVAYYRALRHAGVTPDNVPTLSLSSPQPGLTARDIAGDYASWSYFESLDTTANRAFAARFRARFGPQRVLSDPMEASYLGVHLWAQAVRDAGSDDAATIRRALLAQRYQAPEGEVRFDPQTQHLWKTPRVARMTDTGVAEVIWSAPDPVRPVPFPPSRTQEQWQRFLADLHQSWGGQWSAPAPTPAWDRAVAALPAEKQVEAVAQRLRELNPRFDDKVTERIENDAVTGLRFLADDVDDISPVGAFRKLRSLECIRSTTTEAKLSDLSPLRGLPLEYLVFGRDRVADLEPLRGMPLRDLVCADTPVSDLSPLKGMPLRSLNCAGSKVADLTPLKGMSLTSLGCAATAVSDLTPLKGMPLRHLACGFCPRVSDLSPLQGMPLRNLDVAESGVSDLSPLKGMTLANLDLYHAKRVKNLSPLREMTVESLNLGGVPVTDLSPLTGMVSLRVLVLSDSPATDLSPLKGLSLTVLDLRNTNVSDLTPLEGMPLRQLSLTFRAERDAQVIESLKSLEQINGKPVAEFWKEQNQQP